MATRKVVSSDRQAWVDVAKGMAIILVVLFHSITFLSDVGMSSVWTILSGPLDTFRMPLFFFASGLFAQKALALPLSDLVKRRIAKLVWLYAIWTFFWYVIFQFIPVYVPESPDSLPPPLLWLRSFYWPNESTWFIYALAVYFLAAWAMRRFPLWLQLFMAGLLSICVATGLLHSENLAIEKTAMYFVFFLTAVAFGPSVRRIAPTRSTWGRAFLLAFVYGGMLILSLKLSLMSVPGVRLFLGYLGIFFGVTLGVMLSRLVAMSWLAKLGKRTLPVYLVHFYIVLGAVALLEPYRTQVPFIVIIVPLVAVLAILLSLLFYAATRRVPGLWDLPWKFRDIGSTKGEESD